MDEMDDFGDLYCDLDVPMGDGGGKLGTRPEVGSPDEDSISNGRLVTSEDNEMVNLEEENSWSNSESGDDDDDFRIVLNEDEYPKFQSMRGAGAIGSDEDEEGEQLLGDQLPAADELVQGSEVRGVATSGSQRPSWHAGSHSAGLPSSVRTSVSGRCDNLMIPCSHGAPPYNLDTSALVQPGAGFFLPRSRTIFDVNIEALEQKPWRNRGVDITDYFNFGLNEDSWKNYCGYLDNSRHQANMANRFPLYRSSRFIQGERKFSFQASTDKRGKGVDMPKGRAIQVEGGLSERLPSTDLKRPRARDSDVVIQITVEGSVEEASSIRKKCLERADEHTDTSLSNSEDNLKERLLSPHLDGRACRDNSNSTEHYSAELNESDLRVASQEGKFIREKDDQEYPVRKHACLLEVGSDLANEVSRQSSFCDLQSHSEESNDVLSIEKDSRPIRKKSTVSGVQNFVESEYFSSDSTNDATESEQEYNKDDLHERNLSSREQEHFSRTRLRSVAERNVSKDDEHLSSPLYRKNHDYLESWGRRCKARKRKPSCDIDVSGHFYSYRETELTVNYNSKSFAEKCGSKKSFTEGSRTDDHGVVPTRNWDKGDCLNKIEHCISERSYDNRVAKSSVNMYSDYRSSANKSFCKERKSSLHLTKERDRDHWIDMKTDYDDDRYRELCEWDTRSRHSRQKHLYDREEESFYLNFGRQFYPVDREKSSSEDCRYDRRTSFELNRSSKRIYNDDSDRRHLDDRLASHRYEEASITEDRDWHDAASPREHLHMSWRLKGRPNHREQPDIRDLQFKNKNYGRAIPSTKDSYHLSYEAILEPEDDEFASEGNLDNDNGVYEYDTQLRRCNQLSNPIFHSDDGARFNHCKKGRLPPTLERSVWKRSCKYNNVQVNHTFLGGRQLNNSRTTTVVESSGYDARDHGIEKHKLAAVGCRKAVNKRVSGLKEKLLTSRLNKAIVDSGKQFNRGCTLDSKTGSGNPYIAIKEAENLLCKVNSDGNSNHRITSKADKFKEPKTVSNSNGCNEVSLDKLPTSLDVEENEIEEGELIEDSDKQNAVSGNIDPSLGKKVEKFHPVDSARNSGKVVGIYNKSQILQTLAKMEKRKERFKEPIAPKGPKQLPEKSESENLRIDVPAVTEEVKTERPARKRRWGGN